MVFPYLPYYYIRAKTFRCKSQSIRENQTVNSVPSSTAFLLQGVPVTRRKRIGPILTLLLLAPIIAEVLPGFTRFSVIFVVIPEIMTWGCGALLIREYIRRWNKGWISMLLMGIALAVAEEWVIQQTSIAPLIGLARNAYGRIWGVNWVYFLWAVGYESVWVVLVPVQFTELLFPERRANRWLKKRGFIIAHAVFVLGAFMAWYGWTQRARVKIFHLPPYTPPPLYIVSALLMILLLILVARALPERASRGGPTTGRSAPTAGAVGFAVTVLGSVWTAYVLLAFGWMPKALVSLSLAGGLAWCLSTFFLIHRWSSSHDWRDAHRLALVFGGMLACSIGGYAAFIVGGALRIDWIGKSLIDTAMIISLTFLWKERVKPHYPANLPL